MTIAKLSASPVYFARVLRSRTQAAGRYFRNEDSIVEKSGGNVFNEWIVPMLTLLATAAAMWFVVTDGWFRLFGFWGS